MRKLLYRIPEILHDPVIIMDSLTVSGSYVIAGNVFDNNGNPVIVPCFHIQSTEMVISLMFTKTRALMQKTMLNICLTRAKKNIFLKIKK